MIRRAKGWEGRLAGALEAAQRRDFVWGGHPAGDGTAGQDCALFCADVAAAMTGVDPAAELRGRYDSEAGALAVLRRFTALPTASIDQAMAAAFTRILGAPIARPFARRGDVVLVRNAGRPLSAGVIGPSGVSVWLVTPRGLRHVSLDLAVKAWRVG